MAKRKKIKPMDDDEVLGYVNNALNDALDYNASVLSEQRAQGLKYYLAEPFGNEQKGKSQVVSHDVQEVVDWIMPSLIKTFISGDSVVQYEPETEEDVPQAEEETEYINYLFLRRNEGFKILHDWFQDALIMKNGIVKVYVEDYPCVKFDYFTGIDNDTYLEMLGDPEGSDEVIAASQNEDGTWDIKRKFTDNKRQIKVCAIPPEEFLISKNGKDIDTAQMVCHRPEVTKSDLREMGVPEDVLESIQYDEYDWTDTSPEKLIRENFDGTGDAGYQVGAIADANRKTRLNDTYIYLDVNGDGQTELRRILSVSNYIISNEEADCRPFADLTPWRIAHKFFGLSVADKINDIQRIRSKIMRSILDNIDTLNNGRWEVVEGQVNLDDLITNAQNGVVRTKGQGSIKPLDINPLPSDAYNMLDRLEEDRGKRTGVTDRSRGLDGNTLHSNQAAMSVNQLMTAAEQQIDLIARMFAETGVKRLFQILHDYSIKYQDQEEVFKLRGKYVRVNPSSWRKRYNLCVTVGIGNQNKDQQLMHLQRMWEMTQAVIAGGGLGILTSETNIYNLLKEITQNAGYKDISRFWLDPASPESQQAQKEKAEADAKPTPDDIKAQADMQRAQADAMSKQADAQKAQIDAQIQLAKLEVEKQNATVKLREIALKEDELQLERERFRWEMARDEAEYHLESKQQRQVAIGDGKTPVKRPRKKPSTE